MEHRAKSYRPKLLLRHPQPSVWGEPKLGESDKGQRKEREREWGKTEAKRGKRMHSELRTFWGELLSLYSYVCVHICVLTCGGQGWTSGDLLSQSPSEILRQDVSWNMEVIGWARLAGHQRVAETCLSMLPSPGTTSMHCSSMNSQIKDGSLCLHSKNFNGLSHLPDLFGTFNFGSYLPCLVWHPPTPISRK